TAVDLLSNTTPSSPLYTLSLHDALPIWSPFRDSAPNHSRYPLLSTRAPAVAIFFVSLLPASVPFPPRAYAGCAPPRDAARTPPVPLPGRACPLRPTTVQPAELFEQVERQRRAGPVDLEVAHEAQRGARAHDGCAVEDPAGLVTTGGLDHSFLDHLDDELALHAAGEAELGQRERHALVEHDTGELVLYPLVHRQAPSYARGLTPCSRSSFSYSSRSPASVAGGTTTFSSTYWSPGGVPGRPRPRSLSVLPEPEPGG